MTGRDAHIRVRVFDETRDALDEIVPEDVSRSEYLRQVYQNLIDENEEDVPEDLLREERRKRADERGQTHVDRATFRKRCKNLAKTLYGSGLADFEIKEGFAAKREEARHLPPRLKPEAAKEYVDCLLSLVYLFDSDAEPKQNLYISMDLVDKAYPERHKEETRDIIRVAGVDEDILDELDDATANGLVDPLYDEIDDEDDEDTLDMTDKAIRMGGDTRDDLDDGRERREREDDEDEDAPCKLLKVRVDDGSERGQQMFVVDMIDSEYGVDDVLSVVQTNRDIDDVRQAVDLWSEEEDDAPEAMTDGGVDVREARDAAEDDGQTGVESFEIDGEEIEYATRRERIREELDGDLVGLTVSHRTSGAVYLIATRRVDWGDVDAEDAARDNWTGIDKRLIIWDTDDEDVRITDRGFWVPEDADTMRAEARQDSRASSEIDGAVDAEEPLIVDATDDDKLDADAFLSRSVEVADEEEREGQHTERLRNDDGIDESRSWGYGGPAPPEAERVEERLREAGLEPSDHFFRLKWGTKEPFETVDKSQDPPSRGRPRDELLGNYGIDCLSRDFGLVCVDVDYPEEFPDEELPDTFSVSSPHGDDSQRHLIFLCDEKEELKDEIGAWSTQAPEWGDLWAGANRYVVGPGCQLSEYGCNEGEHEAGERGGCERCEDEDGGYYEIVNDAPIMAVSAERLASLVPDDEEGVEEAGNPVSTGETAEDGCVVADCCAAVYDEDEEGEEWMQAGNRVVCLGGCPHG
jgi:hypothetical protein